QRQLQVLPLHGGAITDAIDEQLALIAVLDALDNVGDRSAGHAPFRPRRLAFIARKDLDLAIRKRNLHLIMTDEPKLTLRSLGADHLAVDGDGHALRHGYR